IACPREISSRPKSTWTRTLSVGKSSRGKNSSLMFRLGTALRPVPRGEIASEERGEPRVLGLELGAQPRDDGRIDRHALVRPCVAALEPLVGAGALQRTDRSAAAGRAQRRGEHARAALE